MDRTPVVGPVAAFKSAADFRAWLARNHASSKGIWLRIFKKDSGRSTITYAEALDEALCYGWIDGLKKSHDAESWIQRFCPRRPRSGWSRINTGHAERLLREGRMKPAGLEQIEAAKADGRWKKAYDSFKTAKPPADFLRELAKDKKAEAFYKTLSRTNLFAIVYRLQTAKKPETRARRMKLILEMLARGKKFH